MTDQEIKQAAGDLSAASIKPRMVDGVGLCRRGCPQYVADIDNNDFDNTCGWPFVCDDDVCPVWVQRMAAWAEEYSGDCVHCGELVAPDDRNHWERCDKHPANDRIAALEQELADAKQRQEPPIKEEE